MVLCETKRNEMKSVLCEMKICTLRNENLYFAKWKSVLCEMESVLCEKKICTLRNENLYSAKWNLYSAKWKSVLCEMKICTLRNENLYFAKWKSVLCEMESVLCEMKICTLRNGICTLRNENLYFAKWKSVLCEMESVLCGASANLLFTYNHDRDTRFSRFLDFSISHEFSILRRPRQSISNMVTADLDITGRCLVTPTFHLRLLSLAMSFKI